MLPLPDHPSAGLQRPGRSRQLDDHRVRVVVQASHPRQPDHPRRARAGAARAHSRRTISSSTMYIWFLWPNLVFVTQWGPANFRVMHCMPEGPELTIENVDTFVLNDPPSGDDIDAMNRFRDVVQPQDTLAMEQQQLGVHARGYWQGRLMGRQGSHLAQRACGPPLRRHGVEGAERPRLRPRYRHRRALMTSVAPTARESRFGHDPEHSATLPGHYYMDRRSSSARTRRSGSRPGSSSATSTISKGPATTSRLLSSTSRCSWSRAKGGNLRAFYNVCMHRGHILLEGTGHTRMFTCPFHAWTYDLEGNLMAAGNSRTWPASMRASFACPRSRSKSSCT